MRPQDDPRVHFTDQNLLFGKSDNVLYAHEEEALPAEPKNLGQDPAPTTLNARGDKNSKLLVINAPFKSSMDIPDPEDVAR
jgi:hypothetical protein